MIADVTNQPKSNFELGYMWPWWLIVDHQGHSPSNWNTKRDFCLHRDTILDTINNMTRIRISGIYPMILGQTE